MHYYIGYIRSHFSTSNPSNHLRDPSVTDQTICSENLCVKWNDPAQDGEEPEQEEDARRDESGSPLILDRQDHKQLRQRMDKYKVGGNFDGLPMLHDFDRSSA